MVKICIIWEIEVSRFEGVSYPQQLENIVSKYRACSDEHRPNAIRVNPIGVGEMAADFWQTQGLPIERFIA